MYKLFPANNDTYDIVRKRDYKEDGAGPYWIGISDSLSLDEAVRQVKILNSDTPVEHLDNRFFFYDEGNGNHHRVDSHGNALEGRQEPLGYLVLWNGEQRIWLEIPSSQHEPCPFGGDATECGSCIYGAEYEWNEEKQDCIRKVDLV